MRTNVTSLAILATLSLSLSANHAAPAPGEKATKWEYAELTYISTFIPPPKGQPGVAGREQIKVQWSTADQVIEADGWEEVADKFKASSVKDAGTATQQKLRLLNRLGGDGWEMVNNVRTTGFSVSESWTFKRRVP